MGLSDGRRSFKIRIAVLIQYRRVTDTQPATQPRFRSIYHAMLHVARVKKHSEETQTLHAGCIKAKPKFLPRRRPHSRGHGTAKI